MIDPVPDQVYSNGCISGKPLVVPLNFRGMVIHRHPGKDRCGFREKIVHVDKLGPYFVLRVCISVKCILQQ